MNKTITDKELWEWCGLSQNPWTKKWFVDADTKAEPQPQIDLNNLFKYAVEGKLKELGYHLTYSVDYDEWFISKGRPLLHHWTVLKGSHQLMGSGEDKDPALALKKAICGIIKAKSS